MPSLGFPPPIEPSEEMMDWSLFMWLSLEAKETFPLLIALLFVGRTRGRVQPPASSWPLIKRACGFTGIASLDETQSPLIPV